MNMSKTGNTGLDSSDIPRGNLAGFRTYLRNDLLAGFLVFLIALPLCLGISLACGFPAIAGIFTAIIGSIVTTFISNSELTIKGPAAGLIAIVVGCVEAFGGNGFMGEATQLDMDAYRMTLAVGVVAAVLQILFGLFKAGILGEFFPLSAVHGMLAAIGVIIISKQVPIALGVQGAKGGPIAMLKEIPNYFQRMNPEIALIGGIGILIMFMWPMVQKATPALKAIPPALVVLIATIPLGIYFDLLHTHSYSFEGHDYEVGESYLVKMPDRVFGMFDYITTPDFNAFSGKHLAKALPWVFLFFAIGSLESLLSAKAVDIMDPWKRKTNMDRDVVAVGVANLCASMVGGLPMISEIVRSKANIDNGARTRFADMWHGIFLLLCVALIPAALHRIPLAALASMLIFTGFRLTHPKEFMHVYRIGREQLLIFIVTLVGVLATDLLIGMFIGIGMELLIHFINGVPLKSIFKSHLDVATTDDGTTLVRVYHSAIFSNWILFRRRIERLGLSERRNVILDFSGCKLIDHSVMEKLHELDADFQQSGLTLEIRGMDVHRQFSSHKFAARKRAMTRLRRVTLVTGISLQETLSKKLVELGASGFTTIPCSGVGRSGIADGNLHPRSQLRFEAVVPPSVANEIMDYLQTLGAEHPVTACVETVEVLRKNQF